MIFRASISLAVIAIMALPALAQEREWLLDAVDEDAFMVFGVPETDDVGISFWCKIGSGKVKIFIPDGSSELAANITAPFEVKIDDVVFPLSGQTSANEMSGLTSIETELPLDHPAIAALGKAERLGVVVRKHAMAFPLAEANVAALFRLCRAN